MQTNMADENLIEETGNQHLNTNTVVVSASGIAVEESVNEDILREAFVGSGDFDQEHVEYAVQTDTDDVSQSVAQQMNDVSDSGIDGTTLGSTTQIVAQSNGFGAETYRVTYPVNALPDGTISIPDELIVQAVSSEGTVHIGETESGVAFVDHNGHHHNVIENQQVLEGQPVLEGQQCILEGQDHVLEEQQDLNNQHQVLAEQHQVLGEQHQVLDDQHQVLDNEHQVLDDQHQVLEGQNVTLMPPQHELQENIQTDDQEQSSSQSGQAEEVIVQQTRQPTVRYALLDTGNQSAAPLGSSQNPIRIIQQGNSYTPLQELPPEQMAQIMQVVHTQQVARNTHEAGGSVVINPRTNAQVMYRVIWPSELHKGQQTLLHVTPKGATVSSVPAKEAIQLPKRPYRKRGRDEEEDKMDGPEMSKEEKEERKKHRPRTRSGRVSKPPKHMVKDYKHIHVLDWDEDYDDSDGGYSDYKGSDEEGKMAKKESTPDLCTGLAMSSSRPKNYKCQTCEKSYIGQAGLARHYRLKPSHGSIPAGDVEDPEMAGNGEMTAAENSPVLMNNGATTMTTTTLVPPSSVESGAGVPTVTSNVGSSIGNMSEDSNTQDSIPSSSGAISPITTTRAPRRGRGGYRGRGRWMFSRPPARKKQKLKELLKTIENEDLMEIVLPRLVNVVSLFEFMLMKVETCSSSQPRADHIYQEFLALHKRVKQVCHEGLRRKVDQDTGQQNGVDTEDSQEKACPVLKLEDEAIAKSLGLTSGSYEVKDIHVNEYTSFRYNYLTSDPNGPSGVSAEKRTIQVVSPDELVSQIPSKRIKTTSLLQCSAPSTVSLAGSATAASSLLTSIVSNSGLTGTCQKQQALFRTVAVQQPQSNLLQTVRVQQPQTNLLPSGVIQQPQSVMPAMTLPPQQSTTAILRTVNVPSQPQAPTVLRTVAMPSQPQTSILRVQQPVVASASKQSNGTGVMGVSLLNNSRTAVISQHPSVAVLKSPPGQSSHILVAAPGSLSVTGPNVSEIPQSQAAQVVSLLPSSIHTPSLSLPTLTAGSMSTDFNTMTPDDFMDNSDDSLVSSVSGLSSANSSGLVSAHSSLPNGDMTEVGFSSAVKVNGVSTKSEVLSPDKEQMSLVNDAPYISTHSLQEDSEQLPVTSAMDSTSATTSLFIKCENGELYTVASTGETVPLASTTADSPLASVEVMPSSSSGVNGLFNGSQVDDTALKEEDSLVEDQGVLLADESVVMNPEDTLHPATDADMDVDESMETSSFTLHQNATLYQTEDGTVIIQNPDGTSFQLRGTGDQSLSLESVQELLSQMVSGEQVQTEVQQ